MKKELTDLSGLRRISYYAGSSFWICDDTDENIRVLNSCGATYTINSFMSAEGTRVSRIEFN